MVIISGVPIFRIFTVAQEEMIRSRNNQFYPALNSKGKRKETNAATEEKQDSENSMAGTPLERLKYARDRCSSS